MKKLWQGRFEKDTSPLVEQFTESISYDWRLAPYDIQGSLAHARMLMRQGYLSRAEEARIRKGLLAIDRDIRDGKLGYSAGDEDIHMFVEAQLIRRTGEAGKKLHTARSRNDQVATDVRLYLRDRIDRIAQGLIRLQKSLLDFAQRSRGVIVPGYTHMQQAQPVYLAHHLCAYISMFGRDVERLADARRRVNRMPLGACALAGTGLRIDRRFVQRELGFEALIENSMDAVSARDHIQEFLAACAVAAVNLSRLCEELVLWSGTEFGWISIGDDFCTGSSIMPQKKNPDVAELVRGKTGRFVGNLVTLLTLVKGLPLTYNRDLQEDKAPLFDTADTMLSVLEIMARMVRATKLNTRRLEKVFSDDYLLATDVADYLVEKGMPFREAHAVVGRMVRECVRAGKNLAALSAAELRGFSPLLKPDVKRFLTPAGSVARKRSLGGTGKKEVERQLEQYSRELKGVS